MASLRSLMLDGKVAAPYDTNPTVRDLKSRETILVNAQGPFESLLAQVGRDEAYLGIESYRAIPRPKPPYQTMWIESLQQWPGRPAQRNGILTVRTSVHDHAAFRDELLGMMSKAGHDTAAVLGWFDEDRPKDLVVATSWYERTGVAQAAGMFTYWLDANGDFQHGFEVLHAGASANWQTALETQMLWCLMTMAQLNCHNVELRETAGQAKAKPGKKPHPPFSVWHEIVVKPSLLARRDRRENPASAEKQAVRLHKVRGHYADYRKGAGLFGKYKVLIWVDEHEAGEADLGTVVSSYRVE